VSTSPELFYGKMMRAYMRRVSISMRAASSVGGFNMKSLRIAADLALPEEAITQTFGILGKRGVGKTHTASVLAEGMLKVDAQIIVLDPLDVWWGLRADAQGKPSGFPIVVIGGEHGDLPLAGDNGDTLADFAVEQGVSMVLSMRHLSKNDQRKFVTAFCERLYHRKGEPKYRGAVHLFIDEADAFAPQRMTDKWPHRARLVRVYAALAGGDSLRIPRRRSPRRRCTRHRRTASMAWAICTWKLVW